MIIEGFFFFFFLLFLIETICCDPSFEPSRGGSNEGSQHRLYCRNNKNYP